MITRNLAIAAGFGLVGESFLIPSTSSLPDFRISEAGPTVDEFSALRIPDDFIERLENLHISVNRLGGDVDVNAAGGQVATVILPCNDCSLASAGTSIEAGGETSLVLSFSIAPEDHTLNVNGVPLYPVDVSVQTISAAAVSPSTEQGIPRQLEYVAGAHIISAADGTDSKLIDIEFHITGFDAKPVNVDGISIRLLTDKDENLHLVHLITAPAGGSPPNGFAHDHKITEVAEPMKDGNEQCDTGSAASKAICRMRNTISDTIKSWHLMDSVPAPSNGYLRPCAGRRPYPEGVKGQPRPPFIKGGPKKYRPRPGFGHHAEDSHPPHDHHRNHAAHRFVHAFASSLRSFTWSFLVPVMIGVLAGMSASLLGMVVGTMIGWVWVKFVRGGQRGNATALRETAILEEEKVVLLEQTPANEEVDELPAYVEKE